MKNKLLKTILLAVTIFVTMLFALGLALTIKYAFIDVLPHYHTDTCYINSCTSTSTECCRTSGKTRHCYTCYNIAVNYDLYLNETNYTKTSWSSVGDATYCNQYAINCYYDDRNILDSLTPWKPYTADGGITGIIVLSIGLTIMTLISIVACVIYFCSLMENRPHDISRGL